MAFLKSVVLLDVMEVVSSDDNSALHLNALDHSRQDSATDAHITSEGTLLVNERPFCCLGEGGGGEWVVNFNSVN